MWLYLPEITNSYNIVQFLSISFFLSDEIGSGYQLFVLEAQGRDMCGPPRNIWVRFPNFWDLVVKKLLYFLSI